MARTKQRPVVNKPATIQVWPLNEAIAERMKHPSGIGFRGMTEGVAWPDDQFTARRLREGSALEKPAEQPPPTEHKEPKQPKRKDEG